MKKYRKRPVVIEAVELNEQTQAEVKRWSGGAVYSSPVLEPSERNPKGAYWQIDTLEGTMTARPGDYVIKGINGEFYPCKPDIFDKTYEPEQSITYDLGEYIEGELDITRDRNKIVCVLILVFGIILGLFISLIFLPL